MKTNKAKTSKKAVKKVAKRAVKKELETSIADKFVEALKGLGHDAEALTKEIKKTSKALAKKLSEKYKEVKQVVGEKLESKDKAKAKDRVKRPLKTAKSSSAAGMVKAEKVVAEVTSQKSVSRKVSPVKPTGSVGLPKTRRTSAPKTTVSVAVNSEVKPADIAEKTATKATTSRTRVARKTAEPEVSIVPAKTGRKPAVKSIAKK